MSDKEFTDALKEYVEAHGIEWIPSQDPLKHFNENELKMLKQDPAHRERVEESRFIRKLEKLKEEHFNKAVRQVADWEARRRYPDLSNPLSAFSQKVQIAIKEYRLDNTPAGILAAAKIVDSESR